jgi:signal transduction histidine kinase
MDPGPDFRLLFESAPGCYLVLTPDFTVVAVTEAYLVATSLARDHIVGRRLFDMFEADPRESAVEAVAALRASLERVRDQRVVDAMPVQQYDRPGPDGGPQEHFWSTVNSPVLGATGELRYIIQRIEDVTAYVRLRRRDGGPTPVAVGGGPTREEAEIVSRFLDVSAVNRQLKDANAELRTLAARLDESHRELEAFSYSVAHDLRTPLRAIDGFSQALLEDAAGLGADSQDHLHRVRAAAQHMARLIDELLALSRLGRKELRPARVDLGAQVRRSAARLQAAAPERRLELVIDGELTCHGDPSLMAAMIDHLVDNAWKFTRDRDPARIELTMSRDGGEVVFHLRDNGVGFDMAHAGKLFGVFERLHSPGEFPGVGIGLATVLRIVRRHGGRIWADGVVGGGATFHFTLPG